MNIRSCEDDVLGRSGNETEGGERRRDAEDCNEQDADQHPSYLHGRPTLRKEALAARPGRIRINVELVLCIRASRTCSGVSQGMVI